MTNFGRKTLIRFSSSCSMCRSANRSLSLSGERKRRRRTTFISLFFYIISHGVIYWTHIFLLFFTRKMIFIVFLNNNNLSCPRLVFTQEFPSMLFLSLVFSNSLVVAIIFIFYISTTTTSSSSTTSCLVLILNKVSLYLKRRKAIWKSSYVQDLFLRLNTSSGRLRSFSPLCS